MRSKDLSPGEDLALFVKKFGRILKNKGCDVKRSRDSSKDPKFQSQGKKSFGKKQGKLFKLRDASSSSELGLCFTCGDIGHRAAVCANNIRRPVYRGDKSKTKPSSDSESEHSQLSYQSLVAGVQIVVFVVLVEEGHLNDNEHVFGDLDELIYDELCLKSDSLFDETCNVKSYNIELNKRLVALQKEN